MQIFKFGGASVKSADAVKNLASVLKLHDDELVIIISAMDKITNALEKLFVNFFNKRDFSADFKAVYDFHFNIVNQIFEDKKNIDFKLNFEFDKLSAFLKNKTSNDYDFNYDQIVSFGEIFSTVIVSEYLNSIGIKNNLLDARILVKTDNNFRAASIDYQKTQKKLQIAIDTTKCKTYIIQGFIGSDEQNNVTTLGREGSDYTAATIANLLNAKQLTLWKDVAGIYNADPKIFPNAIKISKISYREATELAYFGAKVIHPKTARPLMQKSIPLSIRSFVNVNEPGTFVENLDENLVPPVPVFIFNNNQVLLTIFSNDFIDETVFEKVYGTFKSFKTKINLMQNSALSLSVCFDYNANNFNELIKAFENIFRIKYNTNLVLLNIRHYEKAENLDFLASKEILMQQKNRLNAFYLYKE